MSWRDSNPGDYSTKRPTKLDGVSNSSARTTSIGVGFLVVLLITVSIRERIWNQRLDAAIHRLDVANEIIKSLKKQNADLEKMNDELRKRLDVPKSRP